MLIVTIKPLPDVLLRVQTSMDQGVTAFRINFARRHADENLQLLSAVRELSVRSGTTAEVFVDLPGPKSRLAAFAEGSELLEAGQPFTFHSDTAQLGDSTAVGLCDRPLFERLSVGDTLILADGSVTLIVVARSARLVHCEVRKSGRIYTSCGLVVPARYSANLGLTSEDRTIVAQVAHLADYLCASFADTVAVVDQIREASGAHVQIIAKIESPIGIASACDLADSTEGLMLARGDLRSFYTHPEMRPVATHLSEQTRRAGGRLVLASNYFASLATTGQLSQSDRDELLWACALRPDYLLINETSHSALWKEVLDAALLMLPVS